MNVAATFSPLPFDDIKTKILNIEWMSHFRHVTVAFIGTPLPNCTVDIFHLQPILTYSVKTARIHSLMEVICTSAVRRICCTWRPNANLTVASCRIEPLPSAMHQVKHAFIALYGRVQVKKCYFSCPIGNVR